MWSEVEESYRSFDDVRYADTVTTFLDGVTCWRQYLLLVVILVLLRYMWGEDGSPWVIDGRVVLCAAIATDNNSQFLHTATWFRQLRGNESRFINHYEVHSGKFPLVLSIAPCTVHNMCCVVSLGEAKRESAGSVLRLASTAYNAQLLQWVFDALKWGGCFLKLCSCHDAVDGNDWESRSFLQIMVDLRGGEIVGILLLAVLPRLCYALSRVDIGQLLLSPLRRKLYTLHLPSCCCSFC